MNKPRILVVDDEIRYRELYGQIFKTGGFDVISAASAEEALELIAIQPPSLVVSDVRMPGATGIDLLRITREKHPDLPFLLVTAYADVRDAVKALKSGAVDYLTKPIDLEELLTAARDAIGIRSDGEIVTIPQEALRGIVAASPLMLSVIKDAYYIADSDAHVLLTGESGVGKDVVAQFIHYNSRRRNKPFIAVNCASIPASLLASELFGHERGAFTGAINKRMGRFRETDGGTLFLDEIGDMPLELQPALLRAVETARITPVGSDKEIDVDYRLIAATNRNLLDDVESGRFRRDLYYRLNVIAIEIPPLRERVEDILPLARHFLTYGKTEPKRLSRAVSQILLAHTWPGNVRELANAMERARLLCQTDVVLPEHLPPTLRNVSPQPSERIMVETTATDMKTLEENEKEAIIRTLEQTGGNRTHAAELLGITRRGLIYKMKRLGIS